MTIITLVIFAIFLAGLGMIRMKLFSTMKWKTIIIIVTIGSIIFIIASIIIVYGKIE